MGPQPLICDSLSRVILSFLWQIYTKVAGIGKEDLLFLRKGQTALRIQVHLCEIAVIVSLHLEACPWFAAQFLILSSPIRLIGGPGKDAMYGLRTNDFENRAQIGKQGSGRAHLC